MGSVSTRRIASAIASAGRIDQHRGIPHDLGQRRDVRRDDRRAAGHRFERRETEPFIEGGKHEHASQPVQDGQRPVGHEPEESDVLVQLVLVHRPAERRVLRDLVADDEQLDVLEIPAPQHLEASISRSRFLCGLMLPAYRMKGSFS